MKCATNVTGKCIIMIAVIIVYCSCYAVRGLLIAVIIVYFSCYAIRGLFFAYAERRLKEISLDHPLVLHESELDWITVDRQTERHVVSGSCQDCPSPMEHGKPPQISNPVFEPRLYRTLPKNCSNFPQLKKQVKNKLLKIPSEFLSQCFSPH